MSIVSALYDPLGFVAPVVLPAKKILQDLCREKDLGWDDDVPEEYRVTWHHWISSLVLLGQVTIARCFKPVNFSAVGIKQLHVFSDASTTGYGAAAYLRIKSSDSNFHVSFVAGKARPAPLKTITIPRLELMAAVTAVRLARMI